MSGEIVTIEVKDETLREKLASLLQSLQSTRTLMANIAMSMKESAKDQFESEKGPDGTAWPPLAESTKKRLEKHGWTGKMLRRSGGLLDSIHADHGDDYAQIGTKLVYARIHHLGGQAGRNHAVTIPARPYLPVSADGGISEDAKTDILDIMHGYLEEAL